VRRISDTGVSPGLTLAHPSQVVLNTGADAREECT